MKRVTYFFHIQHFNAGGGIGSQNLLTLLECHSWFFIFLFCRAKVSVALPLYIIIYVYDHGIIGGVLSHIDVLVES